jgi:protein ImuA
MSAACPPLHLPDALAGAVWRGSAPDALGALRRRGVSSGWELLDAELPSGGWPRGELSEILSPRPATLEWRLLGPALRGVAAAGGSVLLIGPPQPPYLPGLRQAGVEPARLVWVQGDSVAERLWCAEQLLDAAGAVLLWLPQAQPAQLRRLHARAAGGDALLFALRPWSARAESSPAPLRVLARPGDGWTLQLRAFKRRGAPQARALALHAPPAAFDAVLPPRLRAAAWPGASREVDDVVGRIASAAA